MSSLGTRSNIYHSSKYMIEDQDRILLAELEPFLDELHKMKPHERVQYFAKADGFTFFLWWVFYFPESFKCELAPFHFDAIHYYMDTDINILWEWFRSCLKTEITKIYMVNSICYKRWNYIVVQSYDSDSSDDMVTNISRMLNKGILVHDYGELYPFNSKKEDFAKKSVAHFDTTNGVKVKAKALLEKIRGAVTYDEDDWSSRPDLLVLDDIDTTDSVRNVMIVDKNDTKLRQETIGAMSQEKQRIIFLGNTITVDWIVRRFATMARASEQLERPRWKYIRTPLYDELGKCTWQDFFTNEVIEKVKASQWDAFEQNYLLIPKTTIGKTVFDTTQPIKTAQAYKQIEWFLLFQPPQDQLVIGVDLAEWGIKWDNSVLKARNRKWQTVFEFADTVNEILLAKKLDYILTQYSEWEWPNKKRYLGTIIIENNIGTAFINECKRTKDDWSLIYPWFQYVLKQRKLDWTLDQEWVQEKYWFRTSQSSKDLLIREYRNALDNWEIDVSPETLNEMYTFCYDELNRPNAQAPYHDDRIMGDMLALHGILHEPFVVKYDSVPVDLEELTPLQRHLHRIRTWAYNRPDDDDF